MRQFLIMLKREMAAYFLSPIAYVMICFFLAVMGVSFWILITLIAEGVSDLVVMRSLFSESIFFWIAMLVVIPVTTMRVFAEEKHTGTFEMLVTAPVSDLKVVLAKYFGALLFFMAMWLPTIVYIWVLRHFMAETAPLDRGLILSSYIGVFLVSAAYTSVGVLSSALTKNQISAAIISFAAIFASFLAGFAPYLSSSAAVQSVGSYFSSISHLIKFAHGIFDSRHLVLYLSMTTLCLFITVRVIESRRWK